MNKLKMPKFISDIINDKSPEAKEMQSIMLRMIESEVEWSKAHAHQKVCSKCGKINS